jgi:hypothetical protein
MKDRYNGGGYRLVSAYVSVLDFGDCHKRVRVAGFHFRHWAK